MATTPFTAEFEAALKGLVQGGSLSLCKGFIDNPRFNCCISGAPVGVAKDPVGVLVVRPRIACTGNPVTADYSRSYSPTSTINSWSITWGDGQVSNGAWPGAGSVAHPLGGYVLPGTYTVTLTVTDLLGATGIDTQEIEVIDCTALELEAIIGCGSSGIWYTPDGGATQTQRGGGLLENIPIYDVKASLFTTDPSATKLWCAAQTGLHLSYNSAQSWELVDIPISPRSVMPSHLDINGIYVLGIDGSNEIQLYYSPDNGVTWTASIQLSGDWQSSWTFGANAEGWVYYPDVGGAGNYDPLNGYPGGGSGAPACYAGGSGPGCLFCSAPDGEWRYYGTPFEIQAGDFLHAHADDSALGGLRAEVGFNYLSGAPSTNITNGQCVGVLNWEYERRVVTSGTAVVNYIYLRYSGGGAIDCKFDDVYLSAGNALGSNQFPTSGYTHLLNMPVNGAYLYVSLLDDNGNPVVYRIDSDLSVLENIYQPGNGTWGGIATDPNIPEQIWLFGDFGTTKILVSDDYGDTLTDVTDGTWAANELVRPLLPSVYSPSDVIAILNTSLETWETLDGATSWQQVGLTAVPFAAQCGARDFVDDFYILIGALTQAANNMRISPNLGYQWINGSIPVNAQITSIVIIG